jgi:hypothetical protein
MAIINKTGITNGGTIQAEHVTRAIDALSGVGTDTIIATGSFSGSLTGTASFSLSSNSVRIDAGADNSSHYILFSGTTTGQQIPNTDTNLTFNPNANALTLTGSLTTSGSLTTTAAPNSNVNFGAISSSGQFVIPLAEPASPSIGAIYFETATGRLKLWDGSIWQQWVPD